MDANDLARYERSHKRTVTVDSANRVPDVGERVKFQLFTRTGSEFVTGKVTARKHGRKTDKVVGVLVDLTATGRGHVLVPLDKIIWS